MDSTNLSVGANDPKVELIFARSIPGRSRFPIQCEVVGMHVTFPQGQRHSFSRYSPDLLERGAQVEELSIEGAHPEDLSDAGCHLIEALPRCVQRKLELAAFILAPDRPLQQRLRESALANEVAGAAPERLRG